MSVTTAPAPDAGVLRPTWRDWLRHARSTAAILALSAAVYLVTLAFVPEFASAGHFFDTLQLSSFLGIAAIGEGIVILTAGIDLSVANVITGVGILVSSLSTTSLPAAVVIAIGLAAGAGVGLVNGIGVARFKVPPLVMTLAVGNVVQGTQLVLTNGTPKSSAPHVLETVANGSVVGNVTGSVIVWAVVVIAAAWLLSATRAGRYVYAIGTNPRAAELSGVSLRRVTVLAYVLSGLTAAIAGCLLLGYTGISSSTMGDAYLLPAIAAVVLGGTSILGGRGTAVGMAVGVFLLTVIESLLTVLKVSQAGREMLEGAILLVVIIVYNLQPRGRGRRA